MLMILFFLCSAIALISAHSSGELYYREIVGNSSVPDISSKKWVPLLSELIIAYSQAKSEEEIQEADRAFKAILSGKISSNLLFLESVRKEMKKSGIPKEESDRRVRELLEEIVYKTACLFSTPENRDYLRERLGDRSLNEDVLATPTVQGIKEKIRHKLENNELTLLDPEGRAITNPGEVVRILEQVNVAVGIPSYKEGEDICIPTRKMFMGLAKYFKDQKVILLGNFYHQIPNNTASFFADAIRRLTRENQGTKIYSLAMSTGLDEMGNPMIGKGNNFRNFFELLWLAETCGSFKGAAVVDADLKTLIHNGKEVGITELWVKHLIYPMIYPKELGLDEPAQFVSPFYHRHEHDGAGTNNYCVGFIRLVSNLFVRQPIGGDFGFSGIALEKFLFDMEWNHGTRQYGIDISMSLTSALNQLRLAEVELGVKIHDTSEGKVFLIASEVFGTIIKLLMKTKNQWIAYTENETDLYHAPLDLVNLDSARHTGPPTMFRRKGCESEIEALRSDKRSPSPSGKGEDEDRFSEVAASPNSPNLTARGIVRVGQKLPFFIRDLHVDYEFYKREYYEFLGMPYKEVDLETDLFTKEQILDRIEEWGIEKERMSAFFEG